MLANPALTDLLQEGSMKNFLMLVCAFLLFTVSGCKNAPTSDEQLLASCDEAEASLGDSIYTERPDCRSARAEAFEHSFSQSLKSDCEKHGAHASSMPGTCERAGKSGKIEYAPLAWGARELVGQWDNCQPHVNEQCIGLSVGNCYAIGENPWVYAPSWCPNLN